VDVTHPAPPSPDREIYCNRTLNLRSIHAIGYDMDYTLIHYREEEWELRAYEHLKQSFLARGWPVEELHFDPELMERGLVLNIELGDILEANRFGYVKQAYHGTRLLDLQAQRQIYARTIVDLAEESFVFLNTLFSLSEGCMYAQLVDLLDQHRIPAVMGYRGLYLEVKRSLDRAHMEGQLKAEIIADPGRFIELDEQTALALLDQRHAGKKLLLITNSEWSYTSPMMAYAIDPFLPEAMTWRQLFDLVIVSARKPGFFSSRSPLFELVDGAEELLRPVVGGPREGGVYYGGNASVVEEKLGLSGDQILYVGDHVFGDVHVTKSVLRWRTALILRELEHEIRSTRAFAAQQLELSRLMAEKDQLEVEYCQLRLEHQRAKQGYGPPPRLGTGRRQRQLRDLRSAIEALDARIGPLARASSEVANRRWGPLMRAGNDKSILARQVERYADIYTSRVSNFLHRTPFAYLRSMRGSLPHDPLHEG